MERNRYNPGRRKVLKHLAIGALSPIVVGLGTADELYAQRAFSPNYEITADKISYLNEAATKLADSIHGRSFDPIKVPSTQEDQIEVIPSVNKEVIAKAIVYMSYLDGGMSEVQSVTSFLESSGGVTVAPISKEDIGLASGQTSIDFFNNPITVTIDPAVISDYVTKQDEKSQKEYDAVFCHELYHVIQQGRNIWEMRGERAVAVLNLPLSVFLAYKAGTRVEKSIVYGKKKNRWERQFYKPTSRRKAVGLIASGAVFIPTFIVSLSSIALLVDYLSPCELQAYTQAGGASPVGLAAKPPIAALGGRFLTFATKQVSNTVDLSNQ